MTRPATPGRTRSHVLGEAGDPPSGLPPPPDQLRARPFLLASAGPAPVPSTLRPDPPGVIAVTAAHRMEERRELRRLERRRRRGGDRRGPVVLQRLAAGSVAGLDELRYRIARGVRGDRPFLIVLLGLLVVSGLVLSGPAQSYLDGRARVDTLDRKAAALDAANADLEQRAADLQDPLNVELLARETQGFIAPGEVPYSLVPPEVDRPRITAPRDAPAAEAEAWHQRTWDVVRGWLPG